MLSFFLRNCTACALIALMAACAGEPAPDSDTAVSRRANAIAVSPEALAAYLSDTTTKSYSKEHGTQYSYFAADGTYNLVYPGNASVLKGWWTTREGGLLGPVICYAYQGPTYNPVTRSRLRPQEWKCQNAVTSLIRWREVRDGDPLRMAQTTRLETVLPKGINLSLPTAAKSIGLSTKMSANKAVDPDRSADARVGK